MPMFRRSSFYILAIVLVLMLLLGFYWAQTSDRFKAPAAALKPSVVVPKGVPQPSAALPSASTLAASKVDPYHQQMADQLNAPDSTPQRDTEIIREFLNLYGKAYHSGNPVGLNEDITAALTGTANPQAMGQLFPRSSPAIRNGQLVDRWGTPYWFHPESATKMEIRSAGPDKEMFTPDDIILNH